MGQVEKTSALGGPLKAVAQAPVEVWEDQGGRQGAQSHFCLSYLCETEGAFVELLETLVI